MERAKPQASAKLFRQAGKNVSRKPVQAVLPMMTRTVKRLVNS